MRSPRSDFEIRQVSELGAPLTPENEAALRTHLVHACTLSPAPWERWASEAAADGVDKTLIRQGQALIHAFYAGELPCALAAVCGYDDEGLSMLQLARTRPRVAEAQWGTILDSHGELLWCEVAC